MDKYTRFSIEKNNPFSASQRGKKAENGGSSRLKETWDIMYRNANVDSDLNKL